MAGNLISDNGVARLQSTVTAVDGLLQSIAPRTDKHGNVVSPGWFLARITGWAAITANARWKYAWEEVVLKADADVLVNPARTGTAAGNYFALNLIEINNIAAHTGTQGNSVNQTAPYPANFQLLPVGGGTGGTVANQVVVMMYIVSDADQLARPVFQYQNADFGSCT